MNVAPMIAELQAARDAMSLEIARIDAALVSVAALNGQVKETPVVAPQLTTSRSVAIRNTVLAMEGKFSAADVKTNLEFPASIQEVNIALGTLYRAGKINRVKRGVYRNR